MSTLSDNRPGAPSSSRVSLARLWLPVLAAGLLAAAPFLTSRALGTREAYNYSLATADAVTQLRAGIVPVLAGQSEFAFNGRIHPVRTAPYMGHFAGLLDLLTLRQLGFWTLQNLTIALSLVGGALSMYWALRRATPVEGPLAATLAAVYILCPGVLAAVYAMDLYMTVMTVPFVPLVVAANTLCFQRRSGGTLVLLAASLAICWLAHPPVAFWLTVLTGFLQTASCMFNRPTWREAGRLLGAAGLFLLLAAYPFASALSVSPYSELSHKADVSLLLSEVRRVFPDSLRPVSSRADQLGDFQLGYLIWGGAAAAVILAAARRAWPALMLLAAAAFLLVTTTPVPGVTDWFWHHVPALAVTLTNQWPMQRLYLVISALIIVSFATVWRRPGFKNRFAGDAGRLLLGVAALWTAGESWKFISRGMRTVKSEAATARSLLSTNINLTPIAYAQIGTPDFFSDGVMNPADWLRLLAPFDATEIASNATAPLPPAPDSREGRFTAVASGTPDFLTLRPELSLAPGKRYRLTFDFLAPPQACTLQLLGSSSLHREYALPSSGGTRGFGMMAGNARSITIWTDEPAPETITARLTAPGLGAGPLRGRPFANFKLEPIDPSARPMEVLSLLPLRVRVQAEQDCYLETPRVFIPGYAATVNGRAVRVQRSPQGLAMLPVPAGTSEVRVTHPGPAIVRPAFWLSATAWLGVFAAGLHRMLVRWGFSFPGAGLLIRVPPALASLRPPPRVKLILVAAAVLVAAGGYGLHSWQQYRAAVGPIRIRFVLPRGETNRQQPLLVTGKPYAGMFVYAVYSDPEHIRIGVDVWGVLGITTDPIKTDYFAEHELVVDAGALYPEHHPALRQLSAGELDRRKKRLNITLNGNTIISREVHTFESRPGDITVGLNRIGGSSCEPAFAGQILSVERLPVPGGPGR